MTNDHKAVKGDAGYIDAICPRCKKVHKIYIFWTGTTTPMKYCASCVRYQEAIGDIYYD